MITADLSGKTAIVTGGGSGIGLAAVELLSRCGAAVAANHLPGDAVAMAAIEALAKDGRNVISAPGDISDVTDGPRMVTDAIGQLGRLDILINNAGTPVSKEPIDFADLDAMTEDFWDRIFQTNLRGTFRCSRAAAPSLREAKGAIVSTASVAGLGLRGSSIAYGASKAGVINLTRALARALAPDVRVNAVAPGLVDSPWIADWPEERKQKTAAVTLLQRLAKPVDIAEAMLFLAAGAAYMTGQTLVVDGGQDQPLG